MPPRTRSRFSFSLGVKDSAGRMYLTEREPYRYRAFTDNMTHTCVAGDTLQNIASRYFVPLPDAAQLWWIIADFQPTPIVDPTLALQPGDVLIIPSVRTIVDKIFSEARRLEMGL